MNAIMEIDEVFIIMMSKQQTKSFVYVNCFLLFHYTGCKCLGVVKTQDMGLYLPDGCLLFDDEEVTDKELVGEKLLFMDENPPQLTHVKVIA